MINTNRKRPRSENVDSRTGLPPDALSDAAIATLEHTSKRRAVARWLQSLPKSAFHGEDYLLDLSDPWGLNALSGYPALLEFNPYLHSAIIPQAATGSLWELLEDCDAVSSASALVGIKHAGQHAACQISILDSAASAAARRISLKISLTDQRRAGSPTDFLPCAFANAGQHDARKGDVIL